MTQHLLRLGLAVLCAGLGAVVVTEISVNAFTPDVSPISTAGAPLPADMPPMQDIDSLVAAILERPLFSSSRLPYEEIAEIEDEGDGEEEPQQLQARLTGVAIRPEGREALFEREGSKPVAVKEGGQIDGWTVKAIRNDEVLMSNALGDEVLKPSYRPPRVKRPPQRVAAGNGASPQAQQNNAAAPKGPASGRAPQAASGSRQERK